MSVNYVWNVRPSGLALIYLIRRRLCVSPIAPFICKYMEWLDRSCVLYECTVSAQSFGAADRSFYNGVAFHWAFQVKILFRRRLNRHERLTFGENVIPTGSVIVRVNYCWKLCVKFYLHTEYLSNEYTFCNTRLPWLLCKIHVCIAKSGSSEKVNHFR